MTEEQKNVYRKVFQTESKSSYGQPSSNKHLRRRIAHQNEKIAHPNTMRRVPATILLIVALVGSLIFEQWYLIWIIALMWYFSKNRV